MAACPGPSPEPVQRQCEGTPYRVLRLLGRGAMGEVWAVKHDFLGCEFALKVLHARLSKPHVVDRFRLEAQVTALLDHPNIVPIVDFWVSEESRACLVMELLNGRTLLQELSERERLPAREVAAIGCQILGGLAAAHERGVIHRDIKPDNIFLDELPGMGKVAKILDFGLARVPRECEQQGVAPAIQHTRTGALVGTYRYMSPESRRGEPLDARADLYSTGMTLYESLVGYCPADLVASSCSTQPKPPSSLVRGIPSVLDETVLRALAQDADRRFSTATEFEAALRQLIPTRAIPQAVGAKSQPNIFSK